VYLHTRRVRSANERRELVQRPCQPGSRVGAILVPLAGAQLVASGIYHRGVLVELDSAHHGSVQLDDAFHERELE
jgi:hypothetical protein